MSASNGTAGLGQRVPATASEMKPAASRLLRAIVESHWTPVTVAVLSVLMLLAGAGGAVLQTRLAELARATSISQASNLAIEPVPQELDFTLAAEAVRDISMDEARAFNAALPFSTLPIIAARPFTFPADKLEDYARALDCMTAAIYYEAASETGPGQAAVAQVVLNRMRHPAFPKSVCGVVFQGQERTTGCQFSFTCDGAMARVPSIDGWARARAVAAGALNGSVASEVGMATHYHTDWVAPYWAERLVKMRQIGTHIFYRWTGAWGLPGAFRGAYAGSEQVFDKMAPLSSATFLEEPILVLPEEEFLPLDTTEEPGAPPTMAPVEFVAPVVTQEVTAAAPPAPPAPAPPPILANPMDRASPVQQQRRRLAVPR